jgi:hypothetical protein
MTTRREALEESIEKNESRENGQQAWTKEENNDWRGRRQEFNLISLPRLSSKEKNRINESPTIHNYGLFIDFG